MSCRVARVSGWPSPGRAWGSAGSCSPTSRPGRRWGWGLFRGEWRQQLLGLALLTLALAGTAVGSGLAATSAASSLGSTFGTADHLITLSGSSPDLAADIAAARRAFGTVEVIEHQKVAVPGSTNPIDLREQDPHGAFSHPTVRLDAGRYPSGPDE